MPTNQDKTKLNSLRINLYGFGILKNVVNAKDDFIKLA